MSIEIVLGIETSCDETGVAIYSAQRGLLADTLASQVEVHRQYGGVVPELAARDHLRQLLPLVSATLQQAQLTGRDLDGIAYTRGPGLIGALLTGATFAKSLALAWELPVLGVNHLEGHLLSVMLAESRPEFPWVGLLVSGGHSQLVLARALGDYELLGGTLDDAAGEAFDKVAKLLGLGYPGGAALAKLAERGDPQRFKFPRPMFHHPSCDFSFSGLKTAVLHTWRGLGEDPNVAADIAASFQEAVIDCLLRKCQRALQLSGAKSLVVVGGVSANLCLRQKLRDLSAKLEFATYFPPLKFCSDNGAMIAYAGWAKMQSGQADSGWEIEVLPRWDLSSNILIEQRLN